MITASQLLAQVGWRCAVKKFDKGAKIDYRTFEVIQKILIMSPSSFGLQPWKFVIVQNENVRLKLLPHSWNQPQITDSSHLIVLCARKDVDSKYIKEHIKNIARIRSVDISTLAEYEKTISDFISNPNLDKQSWIARQVYIALGNILTAVSIIGVDACPMEGIDPEKYDEILNLKNTDYKTLCVCAFGYRDRHDQYSKMPKVRFEYSKMFDVV